MDYFFIALIVCFIGHIFNLISHYMEYKGKYNLVVERALYPFIIIGYWAWGYMIYSDPARIDFSFLGWIGMILGVAGFVISILAVIEKEGFERTDKLITSGIYSKMRHPMYLGFILVYFGFPLAAGSMLTLASSLIWVGMLLLWRYWEDKDLQARFQKDFKDYKNKTWF